MSEFFDRDAWCPGIPPQGRPFHHSEVGGETCSGCKKRNEIVTLQRIELGRDNLTLDKPPPPVPQPITVPDVKFDFASSAMMVPGASSIIPGFITGNAAEQLNIEAQRKKARDQRFKLVTGAIGSVMFRVALTFFRKGMWMPYRQRKWSIFLRNGPFTAEDLLKALRTAIDVSRKRMDLYDLIHPNTGTWELAHNNGTGDEGLLLCE